MAQKPGKKSRWAIVAEEMSRENLLRGNSEKLLESIRDFRDNFEIPADFASDNSYGALV